MKEEGFEGTDLATLAHLECLWLPMASGANQNKDIAYAIVRFFYISCFQASLSMREEGFEGTDLATLAHLECLWMPMASRANQNEDIAYAIGRFFYISCFQASLSMRYKKTSPIGPVLHFGLRRERDSNPRSLSAQRFSRPPQSTTLPSLLCS